MTLPDMRKKIAFIWSVQPVGKRMNWSSVTLGLPLAIR